jgi:ribosomal protein L7/L12
MAISKRKGKFTPGWKGDRTVAEKDNQELPASVIDALQRGKKIEAIKRLRETEGLDLKAAKARVDRYAEAHPGTVKARTNSFNLAPLVIAAVLAAAIFFIFGG